jgi:hypothetical protein
MAGERGLAGGEGVQDPHHHRQGEQGTQQQVTTTKRKARLGLGAGHGGVDAKIRRDRGTRRCG